MRQLLVGDTAPGQTQHRQYCMLLEQGYCFLQQLEAGDKVEGCSIGFRFGFAGSNQ